MTIIAKLFGRSKEDKMTGSNRYNQHDYNYFPHIDSYKLLIPCDQSTIVEEDVDVEKKEKRRGIFTKLGNVFSRRKKSAEACNEKRDAVDGKEPVVAAESLADMQKRFEEFKDKMEEERQRLFDYQSLLEDRLYRLGRRQSRRNEELTLRIEEMDERRRRRHSLVENLGPVDVVIMSQRRYNKMKAEYDELKRLELIYRSSTLKTTPTGRFNRKPNSSCYAVFNL